MGKWPHPYTLGSSANGGFRENGHANVFRYQMNCLFDCVNIVRMLRSDSFTLGRVHDCVMNDWMNSSSKQNQFVPCKVLEPDVFLLSSRVVLRECCIETCLTECRGRDSRVFWRCRD